MGVIIPSFFLPEVIQFVSVQNTKGTEGKWFHVLAGPQWWAFDLFHLCALIQ